MKAVVAAFNQEKALVGAFSVITNLRMELFGPLVPVRVEAAAAGVHHHDAAGGDGAVLRLPRLEVRHGELGVGVGLGAGRDVNLDPGPDQPLQGDVRGVPAVLVEVRGGVRVRARVLGLLEVPLLVPDQSERRSEVT